LGVGVKGFGVRACWWCGVSRGVSVSWCYVGGLAGCGWCRWGSGGAGGRVHASGKALTLAPWRKGARVWEGSNSRSVAHVGSICLGVTGSGMLAYYALSEARAVGWEGMQGSVEDVEIFGAKSYSDRVVTEDVNIHASTV
jgi:hypothetical protein